MFIYTHTLSYYCIYTEILLQLMMLKQLADINYEMCRRVCSMLKKNLYSINCNIHTRCYMEILHSE